MGVHACMLVCVYTRPEASGKTTIALHAVAESQKLGGTCVFVDAEHALDLKYARALGVDVGQLIISQPDSGEQALEVRAYFMSRACRFRSVSACLRREAATPRSKAAAGWVGERGGVELRLRCWLHHTSRRRGFFRTSSLAALDDPKALAGESLLTSNPRPAGRGWRHSSILQMMHIPKPNPRGARLPCAFKPIPNPTVFEASTMLCSSATLRRAPGLLSEANAEWGS